MCNKKKTKYYLFKCNKNHDIENNLGNINNYIINAPKFTMKNINMINNNYKKEILLELNKNEKMFNKHINIIQKLLDEHTIIIKILKEHMYEYNLIENQVNAQINKKKFITLGQINEYINIEKDKMFYDKILPIIQEDESNLNQILVIVIDESLI